MDRLWDFGMVIIITPPCVLFFMFSIKCVISDWSISNTIHDIWCHLVVDINEWWHVCISHMADILSVQKALVQVGISGQNVGYFCLLMVNSPGKQFFFKYHVRCSFGLFQNISSWQYCGMICPLLLFWKHLLGICNKGT